VTSRSELLNLHLPGRNTRQIVTHIHKEQYENHINKTSTKNVLLVRANQAEGESGCPVGWVI